MSILAVGTIKLMPSHIKGLYLWGANVNDTGDGTGGTATLTHRLNGSADPPQKLWFYITEIGLRIAAVTSQAAEFKITQAEWPQIEIAADAEYIGIPAPAMDADTFGGTAPINLFLPFPKLLGQPAEGVDADLNIITTNTDLMELHSNVRGFATQLPIDPLQFYRR